MNPIALTLSFVSLLTCHHYRATSTEYASRYVILNVAGILAAGSSPAGRPETDGGGSDGSAPWSMHLFHTPTNAALAALIASSQQLSGGRLRLHRIDLPDIDVAAYNRLLKMPLFWDR